MSVRWRLHPTAWAHGHATRAVWGGPRGLSTVDGEHVPLVRDALMLAREGRLDDDTLAERASLDAEDAQELIALLEGAGLLERDEREQGAGAAAQSAAAPEGSAAFDSLWDARIVADPSEAVVVADAGGVWLRATFAPRAACAWCLQHRVLARVPAPVADLLFSLAPADGEALWAVAPVPPPPLPRAVGARDAETTVTTVTWGPHGDTRSTTAALLPHPACPVCTPRATSERFRVTDDARPPAPSARAAALDACIGPLRIAHSEVGTARMTTGGYAIAWPRRRLDTGAFGAMGLGDDDAQRDLVCLSECCERYALRTVVADAESTTYAALGGRAADPRRFTLFSATQTAAPGFRYPAFHDQLPLHWVEMARATTGEVRLVPLELVGNQLDPARVPVRLFDNVGSTGAASHETLARASVSALREILERDAACMMWMTRTPPPRIDLDRAARIDAVGARLSRATQAGLTVRAYAVPSEARVPVVFVVATRAQTRGNWERDGIVAACSSALDPADALAHALDELHAHAVTLCDMPGPDKDWRNHPYDPTAPDQGFDHWWPLYLHYLNPANAGAFEFLERAGSAVALEELPRVEAAAPLAAWHELLTRAEAAGIEVWGRDITPRDVGQLGFAVVKLVGAGALDIACGLQSLRLGSARLERALGGRPPSSDPPPII